MQYSFLFFGNTFPFRASFEAADITGGYIDIDDEKEYVRCIRNIAFDEDGKARIKAVMENDVLKSHAVFLFDEIGEENDQMIIWLTSLDNIFSR